MKKQEEQKKKTVLQRIAGKFIWLFAICLILFFLFLGFSQTSTFRNFLKSQITNNVNSSINGELYIENLNGTVFTTIELNNVHLVVNTDTLLKAEMVDIKTSPLDLLIKKITARNITIRNGYLALLQDSSGRWNTQLTDPSEDTTAVLKDTSDSGGGFNYKIQANSINIENFRLIRKTYQFRDIKSKINHFNTENIDISSINLTARAFADLNKMNISLFLNKLSLNSNIKNFSLNNFSGNFILTEEFAEVRNFDLKTNLTDLKLNARMDSVNLFGDIDLKKFLDYPVTLDLDVDRFNFDNLSAFIENTSLLKGTVSLETSLQGNFGNFDINNLVMDFRDTHFEASGNIVDLQDPPYFKCNLDIRNSKASMNDVAELLPGIDIPRFNNLKISNLNGMYIGEPLDFYSELRGNVEKGYIDISGTLNLKPEEMLYDAAFSSENLNLKKIIGTETSINSNGTLKGKSFSPTKAEADLEINFTDSYVNGFPSDSLEVILKSVSKNIALAIEGDVFESSFNVFGNLDLANEQVPVYNLNGNVNSLNLANFLEDSTEQSDLNFSFEAKGSDLQIDSMIGDFWISLENSTYKDKKIDSSGVELFLKSEENFREIILTSEFVDFSIDGDFSLNSAIELLNYESQTISNIILDKIDELNPAYVIKPNDSTKEEITEIPEIINESIKFNYKFKFKDFDLIAKIMNNAQFDVAGSGEGTVVNDSSNFSITSEMFIDYVLSRSEESTLYMSEVQADLNFIRNNQSLQFDNLFGSVSLTGDRIYSGADISIFAADLTFNQSKLFFNGYTNIGNNLTTELEGYIGMTPNQQDITIPYLNLTYDGVTLKNKGDINLIFYTDSIEIKEFTMQHDTADFYASGKLYSNGNQNISFMSENISGLVISKILFGDQNSYLDASIDVGGKITGTFKEPVLKAELVASDFKYGNQNLGNVTASMNYKDKLLKNSIYFIDTSFNFNDPLLTLDSDIPVNLSFIQDEGSILDNDTINIRLKSDNFDLSAFGDVLPFVSNPSGKMNADVSIGGNFNDLDLKGTFNINNGRFTAKTNNLDYGFNLNTVFENDNITVQTFNLTNSGNVKNKGTVTGTGSIILKGTEIEDIQMSLDGDLSILGPRSRNSLSYIYGDLFVGFPSGISVKYQNESSYFTGNLNLIETNLTYVSQQTSYEQAGGAFNYEFAVDSSKIDMEEIRFRDFINKNTKVSLSGNQSDELKMDYDLFIRTENIAKVEFIFSELANQKLYVEATGNLSYEKNGNEKTAQGVFTLLDGSQLEFFKVFEAEGEIRFEGDIANPYLDVIATYQSDYVDEGAVNSQTQEVAVKLFLEGSINNLGESLANNPDNIKVYVGSRNIEAGTPDPRYDASDAISFILVGKFKSDLTTSDKTSIAQQTNVVTTSLIGSALTNFVNSQVGDVVSNISLTQSGEDYKFNVSGRIENVRYRVGGTTEVFENLNKANIRIEYLFGPNFIIRLERKEPVVNTYGIDEKINELGLKYKIEF